MKLDRMSNRSRMNTCILLVGANGKMVDAFIGDEVRVTTVNSAVYNRKGYVDGFTKDCVKVVTKRKIGYYLPKNLVFVKRGKRDGTVPAEPYRGEMGSVVPGVISVGGDDESIEVTADTVANATSEFVNYLEEVSGLSRKMAKTSVEFAVLMERGKNRFSNGWVLSGDLEEVKRVASIELDRRLDGFKEFVRDEIKAVYARRGKKGT